eukprot:15462547-Alexandrium_andersonii.AAC.1
MAGVLAAAGGFPGIGYIAPVALRVWQATAVTQHAYAREQARAWDAPPGHHTPGPRHGPQERAQELARPGTEPQRRLHLQVQPQPRAWQAHEQSQQED